MWEVVGYLVWMAGLGIIGFVTFRLGKSSRESGHRSSFGVFEELYHPSAHESHFELLAQEERKAPQPIPGDPPDLPYGGRAGAEAAARAQAARATGRRPARSRLRAFFRHRPSSGWRGGSPPRSTGGR